jgi:hypothetical protein
MMDPGETVGLSTTVAFMLKEGKNSHGEDLMQFSWSVSKILLQAQLRESQWAFLSLGDSGRFSSNSQNTYVFHA